MTLELHQVLRLPRKVTLDLHQVLRLPRKVTLDLHQVLRLPHRMTRRLDPRHIWNVISNVRRNKCHPPNSPNTAPATQNNHATSGRNLRKTAEMSFPLRGRSENDPITLDHVPRPFPSVRNPPRNRGYFSRSGRTVCIEKYNISRSGYLSKFHQVLRLPRKVTLELHQVLRLPRKVTLELHQVLRLPRKVTLELHQVLRLPRKVTLDLHQVLRLPRKVTLELHQVLRLLRSDCTWLYSYAAIVLDSTPTQRSTITQRLYLTLLLRSDCTWLYYYAAIVINWLYYYAAIVIDSTITWLYSYAAIVLDSTPTQRLYLTLLLRSDRN